MALVVGCGGSTTHVDADRFGDAAPQTTPGTDGGDTASPSAPDDGRDAATDTRDVLAAADGSHDTASGAVDR